MRFKFLQNFLSYYKDKLQLSMKPKNNQDMISPEQMNSKENQEQTLNLDFRLYNKTKEKDKISGKARDHRKEIEDEFNKMPVQPSPAHRRLKALKKDQKLDMANRSKKMKSQYLQDVHKKQKIIMTEVKGLTRNQGSKSYIQGV